ncbi:MAG: hypothetical protein Q9219_006745 [cf. Caloplaca sp. 3 TL-2023]
MPHATTDIPDELLDFVFENRPEAEAMREACASENLMEVKSVFKTHWLDVPIEERIDREQFGAAGLCEVISQDNAEIAHFLLLNVMSMDVVHFAMATEYHAYSILQVFMDFKWDINTYVSRMQPPALSLAVTDTKLMMWFLSHGANPDATCGIDVTPLSIAVRHASFDNIRVLFDHGGSIKHGQLLHFAVNRDLPDRLDVLEYLLNKGARINDVMFENSPSSYEQERLSGLGTPLNSAAKIGRLDVVDFLLSRGADPLIKDSYGKLPIDKAKYYGWSDVIDRLRPLSTSEPTRVEG